MTDPHSLGDTMRDASTDVHDVLHDIDVPEFSPNARRAPVVAAILLLVAVGAAVGVFARGESSTVLPDVATESTLQNPPESSVPLTPDATPVTTAKRVTMADLVIDTDPRLVEPLERPAVNQTIIDPAFGTAITRITNAAPGEYILPVTSPFSAWNSDSTAVLLYRTGDTVGAEHRIYFPNQPNTPELIADIAPNDLEQVVWSPVNPTVLYYPSGNELRSYDYSAGTSKLVRGFGECDEITLGRHGHGISVDGDRIGFRCATGDGAELLGYRFSTDEAVFAPAGDDASPLVLPSGDGFAVEADGRIDYYDTDLNLTANSVPHDGTNFSMLTDGTTIGPVYNGDVTGALVVGNPQTGLTPIVGPDTGYIYPPSGVRVNALPTDAFYAAFSSTLTPGATDVEPTRGEIVLADLSIAEQPVIARLAHSRTSGLIDYWGSPFVSLSRDGRQVLFSSDWGGNSVDTFVIDLRG